MRIFLFRPCRAYIFTFFPPGLRPPRVLAMGFAVSRFQRLRRMIPINFNHSRSLSAQQEIARIKCYRFGILQRNETAKPRVECSGTLGIDRKFSKPCKGETAYVAPPAPGLGSEC